MSEKLRFRKEQRSRARKMARIYGVVTLIVLSTYFLAGFFLHPLFLVKDIREKVRVMGATVSVLARVLAPPVKPVVSGTSVCLNGTSKGLLDWADDGNSVSYDIARDGSPLSTGVILSEYADETGIPGQTYSYTVTALGPMGPGFEVSDPVGVTFPASCSVSIVPVISLQTFAGRNISSETEPYRTTDRNPRLTGITNLPYARIDIVFENEDERISATVFANNNGYFSWSYHGKFDQDRYAVFLRATQAGRALGRALESFDETTAVTCPSQGLGNVPTTQCGSVMMFVNLTDYFGMPVDVVMAEQTSDFAGVDGLDMREEGAHEQNGLEIPSSMRLVVSAPAQERQTLAYLLKLRDERLSGRALPASEIFTDRIAASTSVITPTLVADRIFAKSIKADSIEGLEVYTNKIGSLEEKYATLSDASASDTLLNTQAMATYFAVMMKNIAVETLVVKLDGSILGKLSVGGDARFGGKSTFAELASFLGDTNFEGQVNFENVPTFSSDMGGFAVIAEGQQSVAILFDQAYDTQPIVSVSLTNELSSLITDAQKDQDLAKDIEAVDQDMAETYFDEDIRYLVTKKSKHGFTILLNKKAPRELEFSWVALSVKGGKTFRSEAAEDDSSDVEIKTVAPVEITIPVSEVLPSDSVVNPVEENTSVGDVLIDSASTSETETLSE